MSKEVEAAVLELAGVYSDHRLQAQEDAFSSAMQHQVVNPFIGYARSGVRRHNAKGWHRRGRYLALKRVYDTYQELFLKQLEGIGGFQKAVIETAARARDLEATFRTGLRGMAKVLVDVQRAFASDESSTEYRELSARVTILVAEAVRARESKDRLGAVYALDQAAAITEDARLVLNYLLGRRSPNLSFFAR
jgi:hypothetical protein